MEVNNQPTKMRVIYGVGDIPTHQYTTIKSLLIYRKSRRQYKGDWKQIHRNCLEIPNLKNPRLIKDDFRDNWMEVIWEFEKDLPVIEVYDLVAYLHDHSDLRLCCSWNTDAQMLEITQMNEDES